VLTLIPPADTAGAFTEMIAFFFTILDDSVAVAVTIKEMSPSPSPSKKRGG
jgi:hypothetical protein